MIILAVEIEYEIACKLCKKSPIHLIKLDQKVPFLYIPTLPQTKPKPKHKLKPKPKLKAKPKLNPNSNQNSNHSIISSCDPTTNYRRLLL